MCIPKRLTYRNAGALSSWSPPPLVALFWLLLLLLLLMVVQYCEDCDCDCDDIVVTEQAR
jgi:hypothetical protein